MSALEEKGFDKSGLNGSGSLVNEVNESTRADLTPYALPVDHSPLDKDTFGPLNVFSVAFSCINSWVALVAAFGTALISGGPTTLVWGLLYGTACTFATVLSHGEMFAVLPSAGGQYYWSALCSSPRWRAPVSWTTGMVNVIGTILAIAASAYLCTNMIVSMILINNPSFILTTGKQYAIYVGMTVFGPLSSVGVGSKWNRRVETGVMVISIVGSLVIIITLLATSSPKASAKWVFGGTYNGTGYDSIVIAWLIGLLQSSYAFIGFDIIYHVSEEIKDPREKGPTAANWTILFSGISSWVIMICLLFSISDVDRVLGTKLGMPFAQVVMDATGSKACTTLFVLLILLVFANAPRANTIAASRTLLAFGRDGMLPYGHLFTIVKYGEPVYGVALSVTVALLLGLVQFGPAAAFNSLLGGATLFSFLSYTIPCACMLLGGRRKLNKLFPERKHNLGKWGVICNIVAVFFVVQSIVIFCFPAYMPVTASNMNYVVVFGGFFCTVLVIIWFTYARARYQGPKSAFLDNVLEADNQSHRADE